ncbi:MAG: DUF6429 family protein [Candidatus Flexifilum sp.]
MDYDQDKVDEVALALLFLTLGSDNRAWKGMAWEITDRLYEKGWIENPRNKNQSLELTPAGREACIRLFQKHFGVPSSHDHPAPLLSLPVDIHQLEAIYYREENKLRQPFLDAATGMVVWSNDDEAFGQIVTVEELSNNPRYLSIPICTPEERQHPDRWSEGNRKRVRKLIRRWLESHTIFPLSD